MRLQDSRLWRLRMRLERPRQPVPQDDLSRGYRRPARHRGVVQLACEKIRAHTRPRTEGGRLRMWRSALSELVSYCTVYRDCSTSGGWAHRTLTSSIRRLATKK